MKVYNAVNNVEGMRRSEILKNQLQRCRWLYKLAAPSLKCPVALISALWVNDTPSILGNASTTTILKALALPAIRPLAASGTIEVGEDGRVVCCHHFAALYPEIVLGLESLACWAFVDCIR